ncbi:MAG: hypothetical protein EHM35_14010 [Planctomycetaceae bacterium]|nr:MAG: hypothetical protein EHM35_14010 [Planctomycetaceae bacterium]
MNSWNGPSLPDLGRPTAAVEGRPRASRFAASVARRWSFCVCVTSGTITPSAPPIRVWSVPSAAVNAGRKVPRCWAASTARPCCSTSSRSVRPSSDNWAVRCRLALATSNGQCNASRQHISRTPGLKRCSVKPSH